METGNRSRALLRRGIPILLLLLFCAICGLSLAVIVSMQGNARVINYTGIVRGATQRLVKQELYGRPNDGLVDYLDGIVQELSTGEGENGLVRLPDERYQGLMGEMCLAWSDIKNEIGLIRRGGDKQRLFALSEDYFETANRAVSAAERYSEESVTRAKGMLVFLNLGFVLAAVLFWLYWRRQRRIQTALEAAESASRAKSAFLSSMSHEIRTPMNGIIGMTAIARMSLDDRERLSDCLKKIELSSDYLLALINDILDMSRIESGKVELEHRPFDVNQLLEAVRVMFRQRAEDSKVELRVDGGKLTAKRVVGDHLRLSQVLVNLVSNALKFTPAGGKVALEVREEAVTPEDAALVFTVSDTGIGISESFLSRIFEPFEQEQASTTRQYGGTGLGLAISRNLVEMMGGELTVRSRRGEGSQFTVRVTLPRGADAEAEPSVPAVDAVRDLAGVRVLLAEDNEINSEIVKVLLEQYGARVDQVYNGREAVEGFERSQEGEYGLILMDIQMPEMDGLAACRAIRALPRPDAGRVAVVGLSANAFQEDIDRALGSGMNGYLSKPIDTAQLLDNLSRYL